MERLTVNDLNKVSYDPWELCGMESHCTKGYHEEGGCIKGCEILKMYRKLAEYEDLEEQGKILKLPCEVGDPVFCIEKYDGGGGEIRKYIFEIGMYDEFGKTVFLTEEEAKEAMKVIRLNAGGA